MSWAKAARPFFGVVPSTLRREPRAPGPASYTSLCGRRIVEQVLAAPSDDSPTRGSAPSTCRALLLRHDQRGRFEAAGNAAFKSKKYDDAMTQYGNAISAAATIDDSALLSACHH